MAKNNNDLKILINAIIDQESNTISINKQLKRIQSKVNKLKINVQINDDITKTLKDFSTQFKKIESVAKNTGKVIEETINPDGSRVKRTYFDGLKSEFKETSQEGRKAQKQNEDTAVSVNRLTSEYEKVTRQTERFNSAEQKLGKTLKYSNTRRTKTRSVNLDGNGNLTSYTDTNDIAKEEKQREITEQLTKSKEKLRQKLVELSRTGNVTSKELAKIAKSINTSDSISSINKAQSAYDKLTEASKKNAEQMIVDKKKIRKELKELYKSGSITSDELVKVSKSLNVANSVDSLKIAQREYDKLTNEVRKRSQAENGTRQQVLEYEQRVRRSIEQTQQKEREKTEQLRSQLELYQQQARVNARLAQREFGSHIDSRGLQSYLNNVNSLNVNTPNLSRRMRELSLQFRDVSGNARIASRSMGHANMSIAQMMSTAMTKFPIWMASATLFYQPIRIGRQFIEIITEIDTQMTTLKRVMNEDTNFDEVLSESIELSKELGQSIIETNKAIEGFGRQGFDARESLDLTKTAVVSSNVSDLTPEDSMDTLTAAMTLFNIKAEDSISIIDRLNEIDNNFATTTKKLSEGFNRSAASAKTYGVSLEKLLGDITSITVATRESGSVAGNALKSIYSRVSMSESIRALKDVGVEVKDFTGNNRDVQDVLNDLNNVWENLTQTQKQNIGFAIAGRYQLTRFLALMDNYEMSLNAASKALDSQGSAMKENEKYMESILARINVLKATWEEFALTIGDAFLTDALVGSLELFTSLVQSSGKFITSFGGIPAILATITPLVVLLNGSLRSFVVAQGRSVSTTNLQVGANRNLRRSMVASGTALRTLTAQTTIFTSVANRDLMMTRLRSAGYRTLALSIRGVTIAMRSLATATIVGVGFVAIGYGLEKLISSYSEAKQKTKDFEKQQNKIAESWTNSKEKILSLRNEYEELSKIRENWSNEQEERYFEISNELAELMPNLVDSIDDKGRAHLKNVDAIKEELKYAEKLKNAYIGDRIANADDTFGDLDSERNKLLSQQKNKNKTLSTGMDGTGRRAKVLTDDERREIEFELIGIEQKLRENAQQIRNSGKVLINDLLEMSNTKLGENLSNSVEDMLDSLSFEDVDPEKMQLYVSDLKDSVVEYQSALNSTSIQGMSSTENNLKDILKDTFKLDDVQVSSFLNAVQQASFELKEMSNQQEEVATDNEELINQLKDSADIIQNLSKFIDEYNANSKLSSSTISEIVEKYPSLLDYIGDEAELINQLNKKKKAEEELSKQRILNKIKDNETFFNKILEGNENFFNELKRMYGVDLTNAKTLAIAKEELESNLINSLSKKWEKYYDAQSKAFTDEGRELLNSDDPAKQRIAQRLISEIGDRSKIFRELVSELDSIAFDGVNISFNGDDSLDTDLSNSSSSETENVIEKYTSDEYAKAIDRVTSKLTQSDAKLSMLNSTSKEYRQELESQISLQKQQQNLTNNEIKRLEANKTALLSKLNAMGNFNKLSNENKEVYNETAKAIDDHTKSIDSLSKSYIDLNKSINELAWKNVESIMNSFSEKIDDVDYAIERSSKTMSLYNQNSKEYRQELEKQKKSLLEKPQLLLQQRDKTKELYNQENLTIEQQKELKEKLEDLSLAYGDVLVQINSNKKSQEEALKQTADTIINTYKEAYEKQKELATKAIDYEISELEKSHQKKMDMYDEDMARFEEIVNEKIKTLDRQDEQDQFNKDLSELQEQQSELQNKISIKSLDDSIESQAAKVELEKELSDIIEQIEDKKNKRTKDLRKQNLQDQADSFKKDIEEKKDVETEKFNKEKERLENIRTETEYHFNELINNEREFANLREDIINGNVSNIKKTLFDFLDEFESKNDKVTKKLGVSWEGLRNTIDGIEDSKDLLSPTSEDNQQNQSAIRTGTFTSKSKADTLASKLTSDYGASNVNVLSEGDLFRVIGNFKSLDRALKVLARIKDLGYIKNGYIEEFHQGGVVGGKGSKPAEFVNRLFNTKLKPNEQLIKSLKGEIQIPPNNIINGLKNISNMIKSPSLSADANSNLYLTINIDNLNGTQRDANNLSSTIIKSLKKTGRL